LTNDLHVSIAKPPSEFLLTSPYTRIVRYLSGPYKYAPTRILRINPQIG